MSKSIETEVERRFANLLQDNGVKCTDKNESINADINMALDNALSKQGGSGGNKPDIQFLAEVGIYRLPVMIEAKGEKKKTADQQEEALIVPNTYMYKYEAMESYLLSIIKNHKTLEELSDLTETIDGRKVQESQPEVKVDVSTISNKEKGEKKKTADQQEALIASNTHMYTYEAMESDLFSIIKNHKTLAELSELTETIDGRKVYCLKIGNPCANHKILITASIHAREYLTSELLMMLINDFLAKTESDLYYQEYSYKKWAENVCLYFVPMVNPDGVAISQFGIKGLKKESTVSLVQSILASDGAVNEYEYYRRWKSNAEGVDLNRQFDALWEEYNDHVGHPSADHYKGSWPGSAAEANALIRLTETEGFERTISYHTAGNVIYWYFLQQGSLYEESKAFADLISSATGYPLDADYQSLDPAGYKDWAIMRKGIPSLTIEVGYGESPLDHSLLNDIYLKNQNVIEETIKSIYH